MDWEFIAFVVGVLFLPVVAILTVLALSCMPSPRMKWLRLILYVIAGLLLASCVLDYVPAVRLVYDCHGTSHNYEWGKRGMVADLFLKYLWCLLMGSEAFLLVSLPTTRGHDEIARTATLFVVSISLTVCVIGFGVICWFPLHLDALMPSLGCLMAAALWFGFKFILAFLQQRDTAAKVIAGLVAFFLLSVCLYTYLLLAMWLRMNAIEE